MDKDDIESLLGHIIGHVEFAHEALQTEDPKLLREQAIEIEGWASAIKEAADKALSAQALSTTVAEPR